MGESLLLAMPLMPSLLAGEASSFAMAGAYILAGELRDSAADFTRAFVAYERKFRPLLNSNRNPPEVSHPVSYPKPTSGSVSVI